MPELKEIQDMSKGKKQKIIVASNCICNAEDVYYRVFD